MENKLVRLYEDNPNERTLREVAAALEQGAVIIYPTDTLYALGCSLHHLKAIARVKEIKRKENDALSLICPNISVIADYARVDNATFKLIKANVPGPFTFILKASGAVPNKFLERKSTVGIRIPANRILTELTSLMGCPLVSTSLPVSPSLAEEDTVNAELIWEEYRHSVDMMIDGGDAHLLQSTVVDLTGDEVHIVRQGYAHLIQ